MRRFLRFLPALAALALQAWAPIASYAMTPAPGGRGDFCSVVGNRGPAPARVPLPGPDHALCADAACCAAVATHFAAPPPPAPGVLDVAGGTLAVAVAAPPADRAAILLAPRPRGPPVVS